MAGDRVERGIKMAFARVERGIQMADDRVERGIRRPGGAWNQNCNRPDGAWNHNGGGRMDFSRRNYAGKFCDGCQMTGHFLSECCHTE